MPAPKQYPNPGVGASSARRRPARFAEVVLVAPEVSRALPFLSELTLKARGHFDSGFNCAQSVLLAFSEGLGLTSPDQANEIIPAIASGFGGGLGRTGRACGAITGGIMAIGLFARHTRPDDAETKEKVAKLTEGLLADFESRWGTTDCAGILGIRLNQPGAHERFIGENLRELRCIPVVEWVAERVREIVVQSGNGRESR